MDGGQGHLKASIAVCADERVAWLVEVKGPTDHLSSQQRAWLRAMHEAGIDAAVAKVLPPKRAGAGNGGAWARSPGLPGPRKSAPSPATSS